MKKIILTILLFTLCTAGLLFPQKTNRVGTTTANFLEYGFGSAGSALGDAYVSQVNDISAIYWNPAGLAFMKQNEAQFVLQPWLVDINTSFVGAGFVVPRMGTIALGIFNVNYGEMEVTTMSQQEGTGEMFSSSDFAFSAGYGLALTDWFAFGATGKFVRSEIRHMSARALAVDLGVIVNTMFFSPTGERADGMLIGMSISNYGTRMRYDGIDLLQLIDIVPDENGNFETVPGQFRTAEWELPLIFRIGFTVNPIVTSNNRVKLSVDALHPNFSAEFVNLGAEYEFNVPGTGRFSLRAGYKGLFLPDSEYGLSIGGGVVKYLMNNIGLKLDYAYRDVGILGKVHSYTLGILF